MHTDTEPSSQNVSATDAHTPDRSTRPRRGVHPAVVLGSTLAVFVFTGLGLEMMLRYHVRRQLTDGIEAVAQASVAELMDDSVLRRQPPEASDDVEAVRRAAMAAVDEHITQQQVRIDDNYLNEPNGDLVVGWTENPTSARPTTQPWNGIGMCNTLLVRAERTRRRGNPVPLVVGPLVGVLSSDVRVEARAVVDQRVYGFRPLPEANVPMMPLAALLHGENSWTQQVTQTGEDLYGIDERTCDVLLGPDGVPEVLLRASSGMSTDSAANMARLFLGSDEHARPLDDQLRLGLSAEDLDLVGGELALDRDGRTVVRGTDQLDAELADLLTAMRGVKRIWPLYVSREETGGNTQYTLGGFAAGCVAETYIDDESGQLVVVVQPTLVATKSALVRNLAEGEHPNPWIGKPYLLR